MFSAETELVITSWLNLRAHQQWHTSAFLKGHDDSKCLIGAMTQPLDNTASIPYSPVRQRNIVFTTNGLKNLCENMCFSPKKTGQS